MRFGTRVLVLRGGGGAPGTPGCTRYVRGTLVGARGFDRIVRLEEDDPLSTIKEWSRRGDVGRWCDSAVKEDA